MPNIFREAIGAKEMGLPRGVAGKKHYTLFSLTFDGTSNFTLWCILGRPDFGRKVFATIFWDIWVKSEMGMQGNHSIQTLSVPAGAPNIWNIGIYP